MKYNLLVVSDGADPALRLVCDAIPSETCEVTLANNLQEVMEKSDAGELEQFNLLLMNLDSRTDEGWAVLDEITEDNPLLPVIVITGKLELRELAKAAGVWALVEKPVDLPVLLQTIQELLAEPLASRRHRAYTGDLGFRHLPPKAETSPRFVPDTPSSRRVPHAGGLVE